MSDHCYLCTMYRNQIRQAQGPYEREQATQALNRHIENEHSQAERPVVEWKDTKWTEVKA